MTTKTKTTAEGAEMDAEMTIATRKDLLQHTPTHEPESKATADLQDTLMNRRAT
jgi:hypothetical protein